MTFSSSKVLSSKVVKVALIAGLSLALGACGSGGKKEKFAYVERPVETLYASATKEMEKRRYDRAIAFFEEVERQHPYSSWARRAMLMKAFSYYQGNDYEEAIQAVDSFIALHPGNKDAPYAYYLKAMCFYERIRDVGRDQDYTNNAVQALTDVVRRYPDTEYAVDARLKLDLTYDHLAGKEMYVGRFYMRNNRHISAINRFKYVLTNYQTTGHVPEALHRLVEAYLQLGIVEEARAAAAVLGHNYPGSRWYEDSYRLFERRGILLAGEPSGASIVARVEDDIERGIDLETLDPSRIDNDLAAPPLLDDDDSAFTAGGQDVFNGSP
ncbi:MAG: outer membrane protein assembly factor BamD [Pseudomonadota bacterium]